MLAVVVSRADEASEHIGEHLLDVTDWDEREEKPDPTPTAADATTGRTGSNSAPSMTST